MKNLYILSNGAVINIAQIEVIYTRHNLVNFVSNKIEKEYVIVMISKIEISLGRHEQELQDIQNIKERINDKERIPEKT